MTDDQPQDTTDQPLTDGGNDDSAVRTDGSTAGRDSTTAGRDDSLAPTDGSAVGWDDVQLGERERRVTAEAVTFVGGTIALVVAFAYHWSISGGRFSYVPLLFDWVPTRLDWVTLFAGVVVLSTVVVPLARDPSRLLAGLAVYPRDTLSRWSLAVVAGVTLAGVLGPTLLSPPITDLQGTLQPPAGFAIDTQYVSECVGKRVGGQCRGSLTHPLGTARGGEDLLTWLVYGARTVVQFVLLSVSIMVPIGVGVGVIAAYVGGLPDRILMGYVDVQSTIPTIVVYLIVTIFDGVTLFGLVVAYGLFNWGGLARVVRTAARSELQSDYVDAVRSAGAGGYHLVRQHVLPNVADTVLVAVTLQVPKLILIEIGLAFLGFGGEDSYSWGQLIQRGLLTGSYEFGVTWWITVVPAVATVLFVLATSVVGDGLRGTLEA